MIKKGVAGYLVFIALTCNMMSQDDFKIRFERSGGFTGIATITEIDSKSLTTEEKENLKDLIDSSGFFEVRQIDSQAEQLPDQFQYKISIDYKDKNQTLEFTDATMPESFRPLVRQLTLMARSKRHD
jgi:hypothetical protein